MGIESAVKVGIEGVAKIGQKVPAISENGDKSYKVCLKMGNKTYWDALSISPFDFIEYSTDNDIEHKNGDQIGTKIWG